MTRISFTVATIATVAALFLGDASAQSGAWGQCGGIGWSGATTCVSGYTCTYSNDWYSQCLPGTAVTTSTTTSSRKTSATSSTKSSSTTSGTKTSTTSSSVTSKTSTASSSTTTKPTSTTTSTSVPTLGSGWLWLRAVEDPNFHKYLQGVTPQTPGDAVLGLYTTAGQFQITGGQLIQWLPNGSYLYGHVEQQANSTVNKLRLTFATTPDTYGTFTFSGDGVTWVTPSINRPNTGAFLACSDPVDGSAAVYINLGNYAYMTPTGCADETINYYNAATPVPKA